VDKILQVRVFANTEEKTVSVLFIYEDETLMDSLFTVPDYVYRMVMVNTQHNRVEDLNNLLLEFMLDNVPNVVTLCSIPTGTHTEVKDQWYVHRAKKGSSRFLPSGLQRILTKVATYFF
jgi:hypothetical protein